MSIENQLNQSMFSGYSDKSFVDKVLAKEDNVEAKRILEKDILERTDYAKLAHYLSSTESKLLNFKEWDRYMVGKFLTWILDFMATAGTLFDYEEEIKSRRIELLPESNKLLEDSRKMFSHACKELVSTYSYITRSTLSVNAMGFDKTLTNKFEYNYTQPNMYGVVQQQPKNFFQRVLGGGGQGGQ